ncbi:BatD family protein [Desulfoluna butyratoxydans]|uniref:Aerotolerance-related protein batd n=1 Tax=Desulfoluna butyratoxydans TaxID=231438 RepID=A0A4U8YUH9_9BACT|nr:BatD family protein [Desulfoluna butyratoxydans]VFQ47069.1 aerotolerance-related protein batd [Desulfoluna butyratoxydans]
MKRLFLFLITVLLVGPWASGVQAQGARAVVDTNRLRLGESLTLRVIADFDDARVAMPELADFRVSPRGTSSRVQRINGTTTREVESLFLLIPLRTGQLTIPAIPVRGRGVQAVTRPIVVQVDERSAASISDQPWSVTAEVSNTSPYVGEQVVWTFRFQTAAAFQNARLGKPDFNGFSSDEMGEGRAFERVINGRRYAIHEVTELLIPQKAGAFEVQPASLSVAVVTGRSRRSRDPMFDDFFSTRNVMEQKLLTTEAVALTVRPLPPYSGKTPFSGLVGHFSLTAALENDEVKAGDPLTLTLTIQGTGNIRDAAAPLVFLPEGMKQYGDTPVEEIAMGPSGWQGRKTFKTAIVPLKPGKVTIPSVSLVWFDPQAETYRTEKSGPLTFTVTENTAAEAVEVFQAGSGDAPSLAPEKQAVRLKGRDILPLNVDPDAVVHRAPMDVTLFLTWLAGPFGVFLILVVGLNRFARGLSVGQALGRKASARLKEAENATGDTEQFYGALHAALVAVMGALAGRPVEGLTGDDIRQIVSRASGSPEAGESCVAILESVEAARYGGAAEGEGGRKEKVRTLAKLLKEVKA